MIRGISLLCSLLIALLHSGCVGLRQLDENQQQALRQAETTFFASDQGIEPLMTREKGALTQLISVSIVNNIYEKDFSELADHSVTQQIRQEIHETIDKGEWPLEGPVTINLTPDLEDESDWLETQREWLSKQPNLTGKSVLLAKLRVTLRSNYNGVWAILDYDFWEWDSQKREHTQTFTNSASFSDVVIPPTDAMFAIETPYTWAEKLKPMVNELDEPIEFCIAQTLKMASHDLRIMAGLQERVKDYGKVYEDDEVYWKRGREGYNQAASSHMYGERK